MDRRKRRSRRAGELMCIAGNSVPQWLFLIFRDVSSIEGMRCGKNSRGGPHD